MNREDLGHAPIDLGSVTAETKGAAAGIFDQEGTLYWPTGLCDD